MFFCPFCGTLLLIEPHHPTNRFACGSCSYAAPIQTSQPLTVNHSFLKYNKVVEAEPEPETGAGEDGGVKKEIIKKEKIEEEGIDGGQVITVRCQNDEKQCDGERAQYIQIQMRSADEPATTFFKCLKCSFQWRQD